MRTWLGSLAFIVCLAFAAAAAAILGASGDPEIRALEDALISASDLDSDWVQQDDSLSLNYEECVGHELLRERATVTFSADAPHDRVLSHLVDRFSDRSTADCAIDYLRDVMVYAAEISSPLPTVFLEGIDVGDESFAFEQTGTVSTRQVVIWRRDRYLLAVWNEEEGGRVDRSATDRFAELADQALHE